MLRSNPAITITLAFPFCPFESLVALRQFFTSVSTNLRGTFLPGIFLGTNSQQNSTDATGNCG